MMQEALQIADQTLVPMPSPPTPGWGNTRVILGAAITWSGSWIFIRPDSRRPKIICAKRSICSCRG